MGVKLKKYKGKWYAFCCDDCPSEFHPEKGNPKL